MVVTNANQTQHEPIESFLQQSEHPDTPHIVESEPAIFPLLPQALTEEDPPTQ